MEEKLSLCCFRCDLCLALRSNVERDDRRKELSAGWQSFFGFTIPPEQIMCDGCSRDRDAVTLDSGCPVRPCVLERDIANCAACADYPCDRIRGRLVAFEELAAGRDVSQEDREMFIRPYENRARIEELRASRTRG